MARVARVVLAAVLQASFAPWALGACGGDDDAVPIEDIPGDEPLARLSESELAGVCAWGKDVASREIPPGTRCGTIPITYMGCMEVPESCPATVQMWMGCVPTLFARLGDDPCQVLDFAFDPDGFSAFIDETPGCAGLGACSSTMAMSASGQ